MKKELEKVLKEKSREELRDLFFELLDEYDDESSYFDKNEFTDYDCGARRDLMREELWNCSKEDYLEFIDNYTDNEIEGVLKGE